MPIYEYVCPECGHPFERRVSFADATRDQACPVCGHARATKKLSLIARVTGAASAGVAAAAAACGPVG